MSTPTETAPDDNGQGPPHVESAEEARLKLTIESFKRGAAARDTALATLQAENAELRKRVAVAEEQFEHQLGGHQHTAATLSKACAEAASLRERLETAEAVTTSLGAQLAEMEVGLAAAERERDRLRKLLEADDVGDDCPTVHADRFDQPCERNGGPCWWHRRRAYLAAIPHTEGEASAPPKETTP
jgi:hypothetical protein